MKEVIAENSVNSHESYIYGEKQRNESSEIFALTKKLNEVNMGLPCLECLWKTPNLNILNNTKI